MLWQFIPVTSSREWKERANWIYFLLHSSECGTKMQEEDEKE
jgi:hypothetical protein